MERFRVWFAGWRVDRNGFWVRARKQSDPDLSDHPEIGFTQDACIGVRSPNIARMIDSGGPS